MVSRKSRSGQREEIMSEINAAFRWLEKESNSLKFGSVGLTVIVHNGEVKRIEKSIVQKEQFNDNSEAQC